MAESSKTKKKTDKPEVKAGMGPVPHEEGTTFRVWAPNAQEIFVAGDFNAWKEEASPLQHEGDGYWAVDVPGAKPGEEYKYIIINGEQKLYRIDPYARQVTNSVGNSVIHNNDFDWGATSEFHSPPWNELVIYELHVGTFNIDSKDQVGNFHRAAQKLPYLQELGINMIQLMPPMEFPGSRSWGYNPSLPFAVESDYGGHLAFKNFVKAAHERGIAVTLDVIYNHFGPSDLDLWRFDGWSEGDGGGIYFYNDNRGQTPWGHTRPDYGRPEVRQYIRDNALMWLQEFKIDGLRWDATAYIRNVHGNDIDPYNELPEGWGLMQRVNNEMREVAPNNISIAEDLKNNEWIVKDTGAGGAGFGAQWDANFVHPVRAAIITNDDTFRDINAVRDALLARYDGDAFKRVIYTESHDEVANGRARVPEEIWSGNSHHWFAKKRSTLGAVLVFTAPGIPMIFQGQEFLADKWFSDDMPLDWEHAKEFERIIYLYRDLIYLRRNAHGTTRGLTGQNIEVYHGNQEQKVMAFHRWADGGPGDSTVVVVNMSSQTLTDYQVGFPAAGEWRLRFDSHAADYSEDYDGQVSGDAVASEEPYDGQPASARIAIGPYTGLIFTLDPA
ncbi:MAG: alpha-amylase family glycosyl hydrolase [Chloroflexota bacterium]